jgi:glycosyltransferase involved in cell wall biosynthesis
MPELNRYMKGILSWPGFSSANVYYDRPKREKGSSKWRVRGLIRLALDGIFSFSTLPLKIWTYIGMFMALISIAYMIFTVIKTIILGIDVPGYASLMTTTLLIGGINLMGIGIIGEYIGRIFIEVKARPNYVVESTFQQSNIHSDNDQSHD